jgi:Tol biopolymer transport system component/C-terminal processing protease CtpA/Prc
MKKFIISACAAALALSATAATPLWLRNTAISPDGKTIAFTYKGDIFTIPVNGGIARQLTSNSAYDTAPVWSPDSKKIAFASDRDGSLDVFVINADGGTATRLTTHSGNETPIAFADNETVLFTARLIPSQSAAQGPFFQQIYSVKTDGSRPTMYSTIPFVSASFNASGDLLYQDRKGGEDLWRKHEKSASTGDIWLKRGQDYTQLTSFEGNDENPVWLGQDSFAYLSEEDGTLNVYSRAVNSTEKKQLTKFTKHPVRSLSAATDGTMAFSYDGEIYTLTPGGEPKKLNIDIITDDYDSDIVQSTPQSGASTMAVAPSGDEVAFVIRGEVYITSTKYNTTKRITNTGGQERYVEFSPDGRSLVYDSERDGKWQLFIAKIKNDDEKRFCYATEIEEELLYSCETAAQQPQFSPDGKKVAFFENRNELRVIDVKTKTVTTALEGKYNYSYSDGDLSFEWSPDSRWLLCDYIGIGGWNNTDVALVRADGSEVIDLTESGYTNSNAQWVMDGKGIAFSSSRCGYRSHGSWGEQNDIFIMMLDGEAWDKFNMTEEEAELAEKAEADSKADDSNDKKDKKEKKDKKDKKDKKGKDDADEVKPLEFDLANRRYRIRRLTAMSGFINSYYLSKKGDKLYYTTPTPEGEYNLFVIDIRKGETKVLSEGVNGGMVADKAGENLYVIGNGLKKIDLATGEAKAINFEAQYDRKPSVEREYIYDHMLSEVKNKFYDENLHGVDWDYYGAEYRKFLPYINNNRDFAILLSEILGELNASHTGGRYYAPARSQATASLGAYFDESYDGDGLKVVEVISGGPLSTKEANIQSGDIITAIDGKVIAAGKDFYPLLDNKADKKTRLTVKKVNGKTNEVYVKPISVSDLQDLVYRRWVERNQAVVDSVSNGRVAYVHVKDMDSDSFREVYDQLLGKYRNREAVIVDTRSNGGGWLHNDIAQLLSGKEYVRFSPRGQYIGSEPYSQWCKPSVMLVNEDNYSDAHGTPYTYQTLGLGEVIGAPVPGTMTAVWWERQIDPTLIFGIPEVTSLDMNGKPLENHQLTPDVIIYNKPNDVANGIDEQLIGATRHLLDKLDKKSE